MLKVKMLLAAALIAAGSTAALAQTGGGAGGAGGGGAAGGAGAEPPRPSDANPPGALYRGGSGEVTTGRSDNMRPTRSAPSGMYAADPSQRIHGYSRRHGRARAYSQ